MDNIDIFNNSALILYRKTPSKIISWITIILISIIILIPIIFFYKFDMVYTYSGYIDEYNNLNIIVDKKYFNIKNNRYLYINDKKYNYKIKKVESKENYCVVLVNVIVNIKDNIINIKIKENSVTLLNYIKEGIKL